MVDMERMCLCLNCLPAFFGYVFFIAIVRDILHALLPVLLHPVLCLTRSREHDNMTRCLPRYEWTSKAFLIYFTTKALLAPSRGLPSTSHFCSVLLPRPLHRLLSHVVGETWEFMCLILWHNKMMYMRVAFVCFDKCPARSLACDTRYFSFSTRCARELCNPRWARDELRSHGPRTRTKQAENGKNDDDR